MARVTFEGIDYQVMPEEKMLDALLRAGARVPYSCRRGSCHTCTLQTDADEVWKLEGNCLPENLRSAGLFLPCVTHTSCDIVVRRPDWSTCFLQATIVQRELVARDVLHLAIETPLRTVWRAGQRVEVKLPGDLLLRTTIASVRALDYYLDVFLRLSPDEAQSGSSHHPNQNALREGLAVGSLVQFRAPLGELHYDERAHRTSHLRLLGFGIEASAALLALAREAQLWDHQGSITWFDTEEDRLPSSLGARLEALEAGPSFRRTPWSSMLGEREPYAGPSPWENSLLFVLGPRALAEQGREDALRAGCPIAALACQLTELDYLESSRS